MNQKFCLGHHNDAKKASWVDTGGKVWEEFACSGCGRIRRERKAA